MFHLFLPFLERDSLKESLAMAKKNRISLKMLGLFEISAKKNRSIHFRGLRKLSTFDNHGFVEYVWSSLGINRFD